MMRLSMISVAVILVSQIVSAQAFVVVAAADDTAQVVQLKVWHAEWVSKAAPSYTRDVSDNPEPGTVIPFEYFADKVNEDTLARLRSSEVITIDAEALHITVDCGYPVDLFVVFDNDDKGGLSVVPPNKSPEQHATDLSSEYDTVLPKALMRLGKFISSSKHILGAAIRFCCRLDKLDDKLKFLGSMFGIESDVITWIASEMDMCN